MVWPWSRRLTAVLAFGLLASAGCDNRREKPHPDSSPSGAAGSVEPDRAEGVASIDEPVPDFSEAGRQPGFQAALKKISALCGSEPKPLKLWREVQGGFCFEVPQAAAEKILREHHEEFLKEGVYLYRADMRFGIGGDPDLLGVLPTVDKYQVILAMQTNGANYGHNPSHVVRWLKQLEMDQPFLLTGVGGDFLEGRFTTPVKDPDALAKRMYDFCPDIVDQGVESVEALARELRDKGTLYFWWD